jgi:hypothetical protein
MSEGLSEVNMCCVGGMFIVGKLNGRKLGKPRVFSIIVDPQDPTGKNKLIQLAPLPGTPEHIFLGADGFHYLIPESEKNVLSLYYKVTHPEMLQEKKNGINIIETPGNA